MVRLERGKINHVRAAWEFRLPSCTPIVVCVSLFTMSVFDNNADFTLVSGLMMGRAVGQCINEPRARMLMSVRLGIVPESCRRAALLLTRLGGLRANGFAKRWLFLLLWNQRSRVGGGSGLWKHWTVLWIERKKDGSPLLQTETTSCYCVT